MWWACVDSGLAAGGPRLLGADGWAVNWLSVHPSGCGRMDEMDEGPIVRAVSCRCVSQSMSCRVLSSGLWPVLPCLASSRFALRWMGFCISRLGGGGKTERLRVTALRGYVVTG